MIHLVPAHLGGAGVGRAGADRRVAINVDPAVVPEYTRAVLLTIAIASALSAEPAPTEPAATTPAAAEPAPAELSAPSAPTRRVEHLVGASVHAFQYPLLYEGIPIRTGLAVDYGLRLPVGLEFGAAVRLVLPAEAEPSWAVEGAVRAEVIAAIGRWRPAAGVELGASTRKSSEVLEEERPPGSYFADLGTPEPLWVDVTATPARFCFGAWEFGVARLGVGVSLLTPGMSGRWRTDLLTVARVFR
jgi:hypothetical protein